MYHSYCCSGMGWGGVSLFSCLLGGGVCGHSLVCPHARFDFVRSTVLTRTTDDARPVLP